MDFRNMSFKSIVNFFQTQAELEPNLREPMESVIKLIEENEQLLNQERANYRIEMELYSIQNEQRHFSEKNNLQKSIELSTKDIFHKCLKLRDEIDTVDFNKIKNYDVMQEHMEVQEEIKKMEAGYKRSLEIYKNMEDRNIVKQLRQQQKINNNQQLEYKNVMSCMNTTNSTMLTKLKVKESERNNLLIYLVEGSKELQRSLREANVNNPMSEEEILQEEKLKLQAEYEKLLQKTNGTDAMRFVPLVDSNKNLKFFKYTEILSKKFINIITTIEAMEGDQVNGTVPYANISGLPKTCAINESRPVKHVTFNLVDSPEDSKSNSSTISKAEQFIRKSTENINFFQEECREKLFSAGNSVTNSLAIEQLNALKGDNVRKWVKHKSSEVIEATISSDTTNNTQTSNSNANGTNFTYNYTQNESSADSEEDPKNVDMSSLTFSESLNKDYNSANVVNLKDDGKEAGNSSFQRLFMDSDGSNENDNIDENTGSLQFDNGNGSLNFDMLGFKESEDFDLMEFGSVNNDNDKSFL